MEIQEFITEAEHLRSHLLSQAKHYLFPSTYCAMQNPASPSIGQNQLLGLGTRKSNW